MKAEEAAVGVVKEASEDKAKEIEIKLKMGLILAIPPGGMVKNNGCNSVAIINNI